MTSPKTTPRKKIKINVAETRRLRGLDISPGLYPTVHLVYARTHEIDGFIFDTVETEVVSPRDLINLKGGSPSIIQSLFTLAINSAAVPFGEIKRILELRK